MIAPTGLGDEVGVPRAMRPGLKRPLLALGLAPAGIDCNAPDGTRARMVFLLLMPPRAHDRQVRILVSIARVVMDPRSCEGLLAARSIQEVLALTSESRPRLPSVPARRASLADM